MPRNEDGDFELVLGNKQLLSVFFIVVVLLGVFFTMGYIVGRNTAPGAADARQVAQAGAPGPGGAIVVEPAGGSAAEPAKRPSEGERLVAMAKGGEDAAPKATPPPAEPAGQTISKPEQVPQSPPPPAPAPVQASGEPAPGQTFLQVAAVKKPEADLMVEVLAKKGFPARVAPVPGEALFRVLVGPFADSSALAKTRAELEGAGFKSFVRRY